MTVPFNLQVRIQKDSEVRLKIVGTRVDATEIVSNLVACTSLPVAYMKFVADLLTP